MRAAVLLLGERGVDGDLQASNCRIEGKTDRCEGQGPPRGDGGGEHRYIETRKQRSRERV